MKISTKSLELEVEPKLLTDDGLKRVQQLLDMALAYEKEKIEADAKYATRPQAVAKRVKASA
jgi:hypothetical protein